MNDEYTDYSCSTSLERLGRDVETVLRQWHVHNGSDRHASLLSSNQSASGGSLLIRSDNSLLWTVSYTLPDGQRVSCEVPLQLSLWDEPNSGPEGNVNSKKNPTDSSTTESEQEAHLPYSLRRRQRNVLSSSSDLFDNFSTLFGLGQHITLTPAVSATSPNTLLSPPVYAALSCSIASRHDAPTAPAELACILSGWLQTALNVAATHSRCCLPVLGVWAPYHPGGGSPLRDHHQQHDETNASSAASFLPPWLQALSSVTVKQPSGRNSSSSSQKAARKNQRYRPPLLTGHLFGPESVASLANFSVSTWQLPGERRGHRRLLSTWASILMQYCPPKATAAVAHSLEEASTTAVQVILSFAQHTYMWQKPCADRRRGEGLFRQLSHGSSQEEGPQDWRNNDTVEQQDPDSSFSSAAQVVITLDPTPREQVEEYRQACRQHALALLEQASGASALEPLWGPPGDPVSNLKAIVTWTGSRDENNNSNHGSDAKVVEPLLSFPLKSRSRNMRASDRRMMEESMEETVLDPFQQPSHFVLETHYDREMTQASLAATQRCVLAALIRTATLPTETTLAQLVDTDMVEASWDHETANLMASTLADEARASMATHSLVAAMDWKHAAEDMVEVWQAEEIVRHVFWVHHNHDHHNEDTPGATTMVGGFPSLESSHTSLFQLESTPDHVWKQPLYSALPGRLLSLLFVHMARVRSPSSMVLVWTTFVRELRRRWDHRQSLPNMRAVPGMDGAADTTSSSSGTRDSARLSTPGHIEPDPDKFHCLIGQKLQVFNVCLESLLVSETRQTGQLEKRARVDDSGGLERTSSYRDAEDEFFDADEGPAGGLSSSVPQERRGARCPVQGATLSATGDQLYAPYLQRSYPLTTDVIAERRHMLAQQKGDDSAAGTTALRQQLDVLYRLGKPKLLSDMSSFRAANPHSSLKDFIGWYKNPQNPLEGLDEMKLLQGLYLGAFAAESAGLVVEETTENLRMLEETRKFWSETWRDSRPVPATDQEPLFDAEVVTERALDYLETLHPVNLLCQVMAVNLAMAYFALVSSSAASTANKVHMVQTALERLGEKIDSTLYLLSIDATAGLVPTGSMATNDDIPSSFASVQAISSCERVCMALAETEVLVARATSLLHKLPRQYYLVEKILQNPGTSPVEVKDAAQQRDILRAVGDEEYTSSINSKRFIPKPAASDYLLRSTNDSCPCQLIIRYADEATSRGYGQSLIVALSKCSMTST